MKLPVAGGLSRSAGTAGGPGCVMATALGTMVQPTPLAASPIAHWALSTSQTSGLTVIGDSDSLSRALTTICRTP